MCRPHSNCLGLWFHSIPPSPRAAVRLRLPTLTSHPLINNLTLPFPKPKTEAQHDRAMEDENSNASSASDALSLASGATSPRRSLFIDFRRGKMLLLSHVWRARARLPQGHTPSLPPLLDPLVSSAPHHPCAVLLPPFLSPFPACLALHPPLSHPPLHYLSFALSSRLHTYHRRRHPGTQQDDTHLPATATTRPARFPPTKHP